MPDIRYYYNVEYTGDGVAWYPYGDICRYSEPQVPHTWSWCGETFRLGSLHAIYDRNLPSDRGCLYNSGWLDPEETFPFLIREDLERAVSWLTENGFPDLAFSVLHALHDRFPDSLSTSFRL